MSLPRASTRRVRSALIACAQVQKPLADIFCGGGNPFMLSSTPGAIPNIASGRNSGMNLRAFTIV